MSGKRSLSAQQKSAGAGKKKSEGLPPDRYARGYDWLIVNGSIDERMFSAVVDCVTKHKAKANDKVVVALVTYGGQANHAYRIGRYLQTVYKDEFVVFVPSLCKSAGTLVAVAAQRLVMSPFGEIGPLDVQLLQRDELFGRRSGLTTRSALADLKSHSFELFENFMLRIIRQSGGAVSFRLAADISARAASELMSGVYSQINPETLGQDFRDLSVATHYCQRLDRKSRNLRPDAARKLVHDYPSHDFVIDLEEAKTLFNHIDLPTFSLWDLWSRHVNELGTPVAGPPLVKMASMAIESKKADTHDEAVQEADQSDGRKTSERGDGNGASASP